MTERREVRVLLGDLFESQAQTLVNTVNCVGVMGKGIALEFKKRFAEMYADYVVQCEAGRVRLGEPYLYRQLLSPWVLNFPTKDHWRSVSRVADIEAGMDYLERHYREWGITSLAMPALGCSNGQLEWRIVGPLLYRRLSRFDIPVELYAPLDTPQEQLEMSFLAREVALGETTRGGDSERIPAAWVVLVEILRRVTERRYRWQIGRIAFQKLAYFATAEGLPTGQAFQRGSYGPFAPDLKRMETRLVNHGLLREDKRDELLSVSPGPSFAIAAPSYHSDIAAWESLIGRVVDLFARMDTHGAELAATVHFAASSLARTQPEPITEGDVLQAVLAWKARRNPPVDEAEVSQTIRGLNLLGWIDARPCGLSIDDPELGEDPEWIKDDALACV